MESWDSTKSTTLYGISTWGEGYFDVNQAGELIVKPDRNGIELSLPAIVKSLVQRGITVPVLLRFDGIIQNRVRRLCSAFESTIREASYQGRYRGVFPIKVNQQRHVVETVRRAGEEFGFGVEVGSKPELIAAMAIHNTPDSLLLCNGYKDREYIELALLCRKIGRRTIIILEQISELEQVYSLSKSLGIEPELGIRMKPLSRGSGKWESSGGEQAKFGLNFTSYIKSVDVEVARLTVRYPNLKVSFPQLAPLDNFTQANWQNWKYEESPAGEVFRQIAGIGDEGDGDGLRHAIGTLRNIGAYLASIISAFLLSLIFSFLIVLDLPHLVKGARDLKFTKAGFVYDIVAPSILRFGKVLGRAMEAQFLIATINTILTIIGVWIIGIQSKLAFISMIVFFCSFIPVAGVFISSVPICLVALQASGIGLMLLSIVVIIAVHQVEAYILNPRIYGQQLHVNPVIVLIVLTISGKLFGIWGLILGLPIVTYVFRYAIRDQEAPAAVRQ